MQVRGVSCAIGSAPRCAVRLQDPGIAPVHCVIEIDASEAKVRRWSADAWLNGQTFDVAPLVPGDSLQLGPVLIDVGLEEADAPPEIEFAVEAQAGETYEATEETAAGGGPNLAAAEQVFDQLRAANLSNRQRSRKLLAALREDRRARRELENRMELLEEQLASSVHEHDGAVADVPSQSSGAIPVTTCPEPHGSEAVSDDSETGAGGEETAGPLPEAATCRHSTPLQPDRPDSKPLGEAYRALLADRLDRIEQLERELGIYSPISGSETPEDESPAADLAQISAADASDVNQHVADIEAMHVEEEASDEAAAEALVPADDTSEHQAAEASGPPCDAPAFGDSLELPIPLAIPQSGETTAEPEQESLEEQHCIDAGTAQPLEAAVSGEIEQSQAATEGAEWDAAMDPPSADVASGTAEMTPAAPSPSALDFWGFAAGTAGVDEELLGPLARSPRRRSITTLRPSPPEPPSAEPLPSADDAPGVADSEAVEQITDAATSSPEPEATYPAPAASSLPGATPPAIPGLSDSAWAHLRELSIWREPTEDSAVKDAEFHAPSESSDPASEQCPEPATADAEAPDGYPLAAEESPAVEHCLPDSPDAYESDPSIGSSAVDDPGPEVLSLDESEAAPAQNPPPIVDSPEDLTEPGPEPESQRLPTLSTAFDAPRTEPPPSPAGSASFIDRYAHLFEDEPAAAPQGPPAESGAVRESYPASGPAAPAPSPNDSPRSANGDDDVSIDEYMAQLMRRIRGDSTASVPPTTPQPQSPPSREKTPPVAIERPPAQVQQEMAQPSPAPTMTLEELRRSGPVPEQTADMSALRELANQTARSAIGAHASRKYRENATSKLLVAGAAVASGMYLLATAPDLLSLQFVGACLAVLAALYWGTVIMRSLAESNRAKNQSQRIAAGQDPFRPELPIDAPASTIE